MFDRYIMANLLVISGIITALVFITYFSYFRNNAGPKLPPGPRPLPIIGNIMDLPPDDVPHYQHWLKFKDIYGPIISLTVLGKTMVVIHDRDIANEILEKMSSKTSGRPLVPFASDMCDFGKFTTMHKYDETFRKHRQFLHQDLDTKEGIGRFNDTHNVESRRLLLRALNNPYHLMDHVKTYASATLLKVTYGYSLDGGINDPLARAVQHVMANFKVAYTSVARPVNIFPALKHLPDGFPGTAFKESARQCARMNQAMAMAPYSFARQQVNNGTYRPSYVSLIIQRCISKMGVLNPDNEEAIKWSAGGLYAGTFETTVSSLRCFVLAMSTFPEVQKKAQEEIDRVVGTNRLPELEDRKGMPYVDGLIKEIYRWSPVGPLGVAHAATEEFIYRCYRIPKDAILFPAVWWFCHDPQTYSDPATFNPDRFLEPRNELDPKPVVFGFGRRKCPGRFIADTNLFLTVARMLATFNISKAVDEQGRHTEVKSGINSALDDFAVDSEFQYHITPRSSKHVELIRSVEADHPEEKGDADLLEIDDDLLGLLLALKRH